MEHLGNTELTKTSVFNALLVDLGIIVNIIKYNFSGVGTLDNKYQQRKSIETWLQEKINC